MGVPALFRWLNTKYPKITSKVIEELPVQVSPDQPPIPVDLSKPNPNGWEVDNLYLDMNGIVHPCTHPEDKPPPRNEDEAMVEIFKYLDRIMCMVRPRKLLYMAIDGVAPRAKMNQQRSRRFRAAQEAQIQHQAEERIRKELRAAGKPVLAPEDQPDRFDSNCITPGTPFMRRLAECLRYYVADKLNTCSGWRNLKIILSDASVPGEGEHKIMDYIRHQRASPRHDPNTRHVLYGLDADLIMLALATHEPHFRILREDVFAQDNRGRGCFMCGQDGHQASECTGKISGVMEKKVVPPKPFIFLHVNVLREYLEFEMTVPGLPFPFDLERVMDDWVFMCFFVGNDFLPHLPSLEIREAAIDTLIGIYKRNLAKMGGYMSENGVVHLDRLQIMMEDLGRMEDDIFRKRREAEERRIENARRRKETAEQQKTMRALANENRVTPAKMGERMREFANDSVSVKDKDKVHQSNVVHAAALAANSGVVKKANVSAAQALRAKLAVEAAKSADDGDAAHGLKRKIDEAAEVSVEPDAKRERTNGEAVCDTPVDGEDDTEAVANSDEPEPVDDEDDDDESLKVVVAVAVADKTVAVVVKTPPVEPEEPVDEVRLWEEGWRERYYESKFGVSVEDTAFRKKLVHAYVEGLCWVLQYYYQGCQSWKWYYPYHYSPFASDFTVTDLIKEMKVHFEKSKPFQPLEQLMGVLPAGSKDHIPEPFHHLMTDPESPIIDFYPQDFRIDLNGKKYAWQGVAILPFIDAPRLLEAMQGVYAKLNEEQQSLNKTGHDVLFVGQNHALFEYLCDAFGKKRPTEPVELDAGLSARFAGQFLPDPDAVLPGSTFYSPLIEFGLEDIADNNSIDVYYFNARLPSDDYTFPAKILAGVRFENKVLEREDAIHVQRGGQRPPPGQQRNSYGGNGDQRYNNNNFRQDLGRSRGGGGSYQQYANAGDYGRGYDPRSRDRHSDDRGRQQYPTQYPQPPYQPQHPYAYQQPPQHQPYPMQPYGTPYPPRQQSQYQQAPSQSPYYNQPQQQYQQQHPYRTEPAVQRPPPGANLAWARNMQNGRRR